MSSHKHKQKYYYKDRKCHICQALCYGYYCDDCRKLNRNPISRYESLRDRKEKGGVEE